MIVRQATMLDILTLAQLAADYSEEAKKHSNFPFDAEYAMNSMARSLMTDGAAFICFRDNEPVGFLWGFLSTLPWSRAKIAFDVILYVKPECRGGRSALKLFSAYEEWAKKNGAVEIQISVASGIHEEATGRLYERLGYNHLGTQYRKEL
ncbi:hypothetical protein [Aeromonas phage MJG]|uniref:N-acetyltransferase domain-containing protein n=1 Tax=Aeromonas phage MJG TaxID=2510451 RepID=A0A5J6A2H8_9CAUD|nr:hypothetical protein [Aeromonas phage MJG]